MKYLSRRRPAPTTGYEDPDLVEVVFQKTRALRDGPTPPLDAPTCRIAAGLVGRPRVIVDLGGACGATYFRLSQILDWDLAWHVVETPGMALKGSALADGRMSFHDSIPDVKPDLLIASGVLQYLPDPIRGLTTILELRPTTIVLTRTALSDREVSFVQRTRLASNGPGPLPPGFADREISYLLRAAPRQAIEAMLRTDYALQPFEEPEVITSRDLSSPIGTYGWLAKRR